MFFLDLFTLRQRVCDKILYRFESISGTLIGTLKESILSDVHRIGNHIPVRCLIRELTTKYSDLYFVDIYSEDMEFCDYNRRYLPPGKYQVVVNGPDEVSSFRQIIKILKLCLSPDLDVLVILGGLINPSPNVVKYIFREISNVSPYDIFMGLTSNENITAAALKVVFTHHKYAQSAISVTYNDSWDKFSDSYAKLILQYLRHDVLHVTDIILEVLNSLPDVSTPTDEYRIRGAFHKHPWAIFSFSNLDIDILAKHIAGIFEKNHSRDKKLIDHFKSNKFLVPHRHAKTFAKHGVPLECVVVDSISGGRKFDVVYEGTFGTNWLGMIKAAYPEYIPTWNVLSQACIDDNRYGYTPNEKIISANIEYLVDGNFVTDDNYCAIIGSHSNFNILKKVSGCWQPGDTPRHQGISSNRIISLDELLQLCEAYPHIRLNTSVMSHDSWPKVIKIDMWPRILTTLSQHCLPGRAENFILVYFMKYGSFDCLDWVRDHIVPEMSKYNKMKFYRSIVKRIPDDITSEQFVDLCQCPIFIPTTVHQFLRTMPITHEIIDIARDRAFKFNAKALSTNTTLTPELVIYIYKKLGPDALNITKLANNPVMNPELAQDIINILPKHWCTRALLSTITE